MADTYEITADSMKSVQNQIDKLAKAGGDINHMMAVIAEGPIQRAVRQEIDERWETENGDSYNKHIKVEVDYGIGRFKMTITGNSVKGNILVSGRKGGTIITPRSKKTLALGASRGNEPYAFPKYVRQGAQKGIHDELVKIAERKTREILRFEIARRTGLGTMGGGKASASGSGLVGLE